MSGSEPAWTTWKVRPGGEGEKRRCIDYVWFNPESAGGEPGGKPGGRLRPAQVLLPPPDAVLAGRATKLPSLDYPSDHLSLVVR